jgi:uncharacterized membrane protein (DUF4010 family)
LITGLLGGLYSSTAATVVIARRAHGLQQGARNVSSSLIVATIMMYIRLLVIIFLFDTSACKVLMVPFLTIIVLSLLAVIALLNFRNYAPALQDTSIEKHPLELVTAVFFAALFVLFTFLTQYVTSNFGSHGLKSLAMIAGLTDIDPFILSLLSGKFSVSSQTVVSAVVLASGSNNLLKAAYAFALARNRSVLFAAVWLILLFVVSTLYAYKFIA